MARMIPPVIDPDNPSPGEPEVFRRLKEDPQTADWIVLHSLEVAHHLQQVEGEIDFVVIIPNKGVLCVEVKGHSHIRCLDGQWLFGSREDPDRSPFKQVSDAMHSIRGRVTARRRNLSRVPFWSCVILPFVQFPYESEEWHSWQLIDSRAFRTRPISTLLLNVIDRARDFLAHQPTARWFDPSSMEPTENQCEDISQILRPIFEVFESPKDRRKREEAVMKQYTEEQFDALDALEDNPRVIFTGPAGTGKTLLAIEAARRASNRGHRVLLTCFNELLGHWLADQVSPLPGVSAGTLHQHMLRVAGPGVPIEAGSRRFWRETLPLLATDKLLDNMDQNHTFDEIIVDEAQDLLRDSYLDFLDLSLKGGLAGGKLRLFGDFEKQAINDEADISLQAFKEQRCRDAVTYSLRNNCRNTPRVASLVRLLCDLDPDYRRILRPDNDVEPRTRYYTDESSKERLLIETLEALRQEGFTNDEIVVISPKSDAHSTAAAIRTPQWRQRLQPIRQAKRGYVRYGTIQAFKGLEAPAIVVTDIDRVDDDRAKALFYIAITRAIHRLVVLASDQAKKDIVQL